MARSRESAVWILLPVEKLTHESEGIVRHSRASGNPSALPALDFGLRRSDGPRLVAQLACQYRLLGL